jgi:hypothetical protein
MTSILILVNCTSGKARLEPMLVVEEMMIRTMMTAVDVMVQDALAWAVGIGISPLDQRGQLHKRGADGYASAC